jgi:aryl-alcohol dehydrogenase
VRATAAVLRATDGPLQLEDVTLDEVGAGEVLVRIVGVGLCHTDLLPRVAPGIPLPIVPGHEGAGVVQTVGSDVVDVVVGDHVVLSFTSCGSCRGCLAGRPARCERFFAVNMSGLRSDGSTCATDVHGQRVSARWFGQSALATHSIVAARDVVKVDPGLPLQLLGPLGCGVQTGAGAVRNSLAVEEGSSFVVFGAGAVGQSAVMAARVAGAVRIVVVDINPARLDLATELGATYVIAGDAEDLSRQLRKATGGGADYALDTTGVPAVIGTAIDALRPVGVCGLVGAQRGDLRINPMQLATGRTVKGILEGDAVPRLFIPELIELWRQGRFPFDKLIETFPLAEINAAENAMHTGKVVKPVLLP